ncbi:hypothetical protein CJ671_01760 [Aliarcobacter cryaerophilus]|uniref:Uncharacterized protein n=1 Tax=Aliarcobacter cryaerophilus TaxID=28198 RepID=A0A2S9SVD2_9BACT|nr:hypothetical protein [Aliarcobacter cryaerophilus]PRM90555.1 hypothetical protein CJ671_01760 [Aliarcobacter cryaerophilus]
MSILNKKTIQQVFHAIKQSRIFTINDFKIEFPDKGNILVKIEFRASSKYSFSIEENLISDNIFSLTLSKPKDEKLVLQTVEIPGNIKNFERITHENIDECINVILSWLYNLDTELKNDFSFELEEQAELEEFEQKLNEKFPDDNERFSKEEKEILIEKINDLLKRVEQLEENQHKEQQIKVLEDSKKELEKYPKKAWYLKIYNRIHNINNGFILINSIKDNLQKFLNF